MACSSHRFDEGSLGEMLKSAQVEHTSSFLQPQISSIQTVNTVSAQTDKWQLIP